MIECSLTPGQDLCMRLLVEEGMLTYTEIGERIFLNGGSWEEDAHLLSGQTLQMLHNDLQGLLQKDLLSSVKISGQIAYFIPR